MQIWYIANGIVQTGLLVEQDASCASLIIPTTDWPPQKMTWWEKFADSFPIFQAIMFRRERLILRIDRFIRSEIHHPDNKSHLCQVINPIRKITSTYRECHCHEPLIETHRYCYDDVMSDTII